MGYHSYFLLETVLILDAIAFAYEYRLGSDGDLRPDVGQLGPDKTMEINDEDSCDVSDVFQLDYYVSGGDDILTMKARKTIHMK